MATHSIPVTLTFETGYPPELGVAVVVDRSPPERALRALFATGLCFAFAFLFVFVPLAHFVMVPSLVVAGIVLGVTRLRETSSLVELRGRCPRCKEAKVLPASGRFRDNRPLRCNQCAEKITMTVRPAQLASEPAA